MKMGIRDFRSTGLLVFLLVFNFILGYYIFNTYQNTEGNYIYPLDDTYIHLSVAKNFSLYGNWGVVKDEFCSTISSPVFTLMIAFLMKIFGDSQFYPLFLNIIFANLLIVLIYYYYRDNKLKFAAVSFFLLTPVLLHIQVLSGMEHTLHILLIVATFILLHKILKGQTDRTIIISYLFLVGLLCLTRYESMFYLVGMVFVLLLNNKFRLAYLTLLIGFIPVVAFGVYSVSNGGYFFPNSLLIKSYLAISGDTVLVIKNYISRLNNILVYTITILILIRFIINYQTNVRRIFGFVKTNSLLFLILISIFSHSFFAKFGWLFRYEAYLYILLCLGIVNEVADYGALRLKIKQFKSSLALALIPFLIFGAYHVLLRLYKSDQVIRYAGKNIYEQQIQMSKFLKEFYNNEGIVANDIGAISYFADIKLLDLVGLGSNVTLRQLRAHPESNVSLMPLLTTPPYDKYKILVVYESWYEDELKKNNLIKVADWQIDNNVICGDDRVSFYSTDISEAAQLKQNLVAFKQNMPHDIEVSIQ